MTFDKQAYWNRRRAGERGQEPVEHKFYPKGTKVAYTTREDKESEYPNAEGKVFARTKQGPVALSRKDARRRVTDRDYTKPNFKYRTHREKVPFKGHAKNLKPYQLSFPPEQTNHQRMLARAKERA